MLSKIHMNCSKMHDKQRPIKAKLEHSCFHVQNNYNKKNTSSCPPYFFLLSQCFGHHSSIFNITRSILLPWKILMATPQVTLDGAASDFTVPGEATNLRWHIIMIYDICHDRQNRDQKKFYIHSSLSPQQG